MMSQSPTNLPTIPPTMPGAISIAPRRAAWPAVIGIIGIVLASFGVLGSLMSLFSQVMVAAFKSSGDPTLQASVAGAEMYRVQTFVYGSFAILLSGAMLWIFIRIANRKPTRPRTVIAWAIAKIVIETLGIWVTLLVNEVNMKAMTQGGTITGPQAVIMSTFGGAFASFIVIFGFILTNIFPTFCLIWFLRRTVHTEMATWSNRRAA